MGVYKRKGAKGTTYYVEFEYNGQRIKRSARAGAGIKEARELEAQLRKELQQATHARRVGKSLKRTFGQVLVEWLNGATGSVPDAKLKSHIRCARPYIENRLLEDAKQVAVEMTQAMLKQGLKPATINRRLFVILRCLNIAKDTLEWITWPTDNLVHMLDENNKREVYLTPEQVSKLMANCKAIHVDAPRAIKALVVSGLRVGELLTLTPERMAPDNAAILLPSRSTKSKKPRRIPIGEMYRDLFNPLPFALTYKQLYTSWTQARAAIGMPDLRIHDLRHTFASWLADAGAHLQDLQDLLGHADIQTTMRYVTLISGRHDHVVAKLPSLSVASNEATKDEAA